MYGDLACLCPKHKTFHTDEVTDVEQSLEHLIIQVLVLAWTNVVACDIHLHASFRVLKLNEARLSHHSTTHHTASDAHLPWLVVVLEVCLDVSREGIRWILCCWVWVDSHLAQLLQTLSSAYFLFA